MHITVIDVAEEVLNKCVISDPTKKEDDEDYNVLFSYEFIEDFRDPDTYTSSKGPIVLKVHPDFRYVLAHSQLRL